MSTEQLDSVEQSIKKAKVTLDFGAALLRLRSNKDFKKVILEGYMQDEAIRLVHAKADPNMQSELAQASIVKQMDAIGAFMQFMNTSLHLARLAEKQIDADEATREELLAEALE